MRSLNGAEPHEGKLNFRQAERHMPGCNGKATEHTEYMFKMEALT